jgi:hypothetical protein
LVLAFRASSKSHPLHTPFAPWGNAGSLIRISYGYGGDKLFPFDPQQSVDLRFLDEDAISPDRSQSFRVYG